jgi:adenosylmethionine-8-amino-7-oxononanoate aminotransferase
MTARHLLLNMTANGSADPLVIGGGEGTYLTAADGRRLIDGLSGLYCSQLGYAYADEIAEAAAKQLRELSYAPLWSATAHPAAIELAGCLASLAPEGINHTFFTSGGAESVETAWKIARKYHALRGEPGRTKAIAREGAYHGLTLGALSFTDDPGLTEPYGPPAIPTRFVSNTRRPSGTPELLSEIETLILAEDPGTIAMLIAEPVQNRGGCITPPEGYWQGLRDLADRYGFLLVADEVITAFGRLGEWFGGSCFDARPDLITIAKGVTSGYAPLGAAMAHDRVADVLNRPGVVLNHGYTFSGHPLSCAVASRTIEIMRRERVLDNVRTHQDRLAGSMAELEHLPIVGEVRGRGYFYAAELAPGDADRPFCMEEREALIRDLIPRRLREAGLLARVYDRAQPLVQIAPPLVCTAAELDRIVGILAETLDEASRML